MESIPYESLLNKRQERNVSRFKRGTVTFIVGMQYGSEAKGSIIQYLSPGVSNAVRTGAVNAGHTVYFHDKAEVMRQIPSAWMNPTTTLLLGAGALISPHVLFNEINRLERYVPIKKRLMIDAHAHVITEEQIVEEAKGDLAERIGSTSSRGREGIGVAMADKVLRSTRSIQAKDFSPLKEYIANTSEYLNNELEQGADVLVEGTQGFSLSIDHGDFPYVTSRNATVSALADSIGIQPEYFPTDIIGVVRSYPIRVAGNSGPFAEGSQELSWEEMRNRMGDTRLPIEKTSVTGLERRIATFSDSQYQAACRINRPTEIALTFADYIDQKSYNQSFIAPNSPIHSFIHHLEYLYDAPISLVNTGPRSTIDFDWTRSSRLDQIDTTPLLDISPTY